MSAAKVLKTRLRGDLKEAMKARRQADAKAIRTLIAAIDNAEAPPQSAEQASVMSVDFAAGGAEVMRLDLDAAQLDAIVQAEMTSLIEAAEELEQHRQMEVAAGLRAAAEFLARYRA